MGEPRTARLLTLLLTVGLSSTSALAHMGAKFEPPDGQVLHGLGQYVPSYFGYSDAENWQFVSDYQFVVGHAPVIYAAYAGIHPLDPILNNTNLADIVQNHGYVYNLNLGIDLHDPDESIDVTAILNGDYDSRIADLATEVGSLGVPTFVRPGFEFGIGSDGAHSGISGPDFILVWNHVRAVFASVGPENVAWVWNAVNPNQFDYMSYYPGDTEVDWWGINYFTTGQMNGSEQFVLDAAAHGKPVMICESSPIHNGGTENPDNWQNWFVPFFGKISGHTHLKAFTYISDPWDREGFWDWWATSLIDPNTPAGIRESFAEEMSSTRYIHNTPLPPFACDDGLDNDGDGLCDTALSACTDGSTPGDSGCADAGDLDERSLELACDDGADNDGDGRTDFDPATFADPGGQDSLPAGEGDPGCKDPSWNTEDPQCQDGINNDSGQDPDGQIDYDAGYFLNGVPDPAGPDPQCLGKPWKNKERTGSGCGLGLELALLLPPLIRLERRRGRAQGST